MTNDNEALNPDGNDKEEVVNMDEVLEREKEIAEEVPEEESEDDEDDEIPEDESVENETEEIPAEKAE